MPRGIGARLSRRHSWIAILVALPGVAVCLFALGGFLRTVITNGLSFHPELSASEHYQAVGHAYATGFVVGFFLCFSLVLVALGVGAMMERRRPPRLARAGDRDEGRSPFSAARPIQ